MPALEEQVVEYSRLVQYSTVLTEAQRGGFWFGVCNNKIFGYRKSDWSTSERKTLHILLHHVGSTDAIFFKFLPLKRILSLF